MAECKWHDGPRVRLGAEVVDRCGTCGHRLETGGIAPVQTRYVPSLWFVEHARRRRARLSWANTRRTWAP